MRIKSITTVLRTSNGLDDHALFMALVRTNIEIINFDDRQYAWHSFPNLIYRFTRWIFRKKLGRDLNHELIRYLKASNPSYLIVFKHSLLSKKVLDVAKSVGAKSICIYPDIDPAVHGKAYLEALCNFDYFFHTKPNLMQYFVDNINPNAKLIGPLFDRRHVADISIPDHSVGVSFIGHHSTIKQIDLMRFAALYSGNMTIVGDRWSQDIFSGSKAKITILPALYGQAIYDLYRKSICCIGLLTESISRGMPGDEVTSRTVLVPAYGGVLLHKRTPAAEIVFSVDSPLLFDTIESAVKIAEQLKGNPELREILAKQQQSQALAFGTNVDNFIEELLCL